MTLTPKQVEWAVKGVVSLSLYNLVAFTMDARAGKTLPTIRACELMNYKELLVITTKQAIEGWLHTIKEYNPSIHITVITKEWAKSYIPEQVEIDRVKAVDKLHSRYNKYWLDSTIDTEFIQSRLDNDLRDLHKSYDRKLVNFNAVVVDESHLGSSGFPYAGVRRDEVGSIVNSNSNNWYYLRYHCKGKPLILVSATMAAETPFRYYNQFGLSDYTPFKEREPMKWAYSHGGYMDGRVMTANEDTKLSILKACSHLLVQGTRKEAGHTHEPEIVNLSVPLDGATITSLAEIAKDAVTTINGNQVIAETLSLERSLLHQIEGGTVKLPEGSIFTGGTAKIDAIKDKCKELSVTDSEIVIMYQFTHEYILLRGEFPNAIIQQGSKVTGYDLYDIEVMFIYSMDYSTSNYEQRISRQCNVKRLHPIIIYILTSPNCISEAVYNRVIEKHKFNIRGTNYTVADYAKHYPERVSKYKYKTKETK